VSHPPYEPVQGGAKKIKDLCFLGTQAFNKGLDKEMGMSGTDAFAPMVESKIKHAG